jgi:hypothetical protein
MPFFPLNCRIAATDQYRSGEPAALSDAANESNRDKCRIPYAAPVKMSFAERVEPRQMPYPLRRIYSQDELR